MNDDIKKEDLQLLKDLIESLDQNGEVFKLSKIIVEEYDNGKHKEKVKNIKEGEK